MRLPDVVCAPSPKAVSYPTHSRSKHRHHTYKSKTCGFFCWDCKMTSEQLESFYSVPCLPDEFKSPPGDTEEVFTPRKGEAAALQKQIKERQDKIKLLHELQQEEVHLQSLIARKRALTIPTFQVCNLLAYSIQDIKKNICRSTLHYCNMFFSRVSIINFLLIPTSPSNFKVWTMPRLSS